MDNVLITSRRNPTAMKARSVRDGKSRDLIFVEGLRLCEEAHESGLVVETALYLDGLGSNERAGQLLRALVKESVPSFPITREVLESISDTRTPQGLVLLARRPRTSRESVFLSPAETLPLIVVLHEVNNPSNAGAILRVSEAAGATSVVATRGTTDLFSPKSLRAAMGSAFRLPIWTGAAIDEVLSTCTANAIKTVSTDLRATATHAGIDWKLPRAVILGGEADGLPTDIAIATDERIRIPMRPPVESLNVAVALAVVLYEAARQRGAV